jgi:hypothetical protein
MAKVNRVQDEFRRMMRDRPRNMLPKGACWTIQDGIPNLDAPLRTRGGWANYSDDIAATIATSSYVIAGIYAEQLATPRLVGIDEDGRLFRVATDGTGDVTDIGATGATVVLQNPVQLGARIIIAGPGVAPQTWDGTTLGNLGGSPPTFARYPGVWKALCLLGGTVSQPQRLYFSTADNNPQSWDTTNTFWDFSYPIAGLAPLRNAVLVFHDDYTSRLRGSTPPPGGDLIADDPLFNIGCADARSIGFWNEQVVWAATDGLYISDGIIPNDLTRLCGMKKYWQELLGTYAPSTWTITGGVIRNSYVVCVMDGTTFKGAAIIDLTSNGWVNVTNLDARSMWRTTALDGSERLFFGRRGAARVGELSSMWTPSSTYKNDGDGDAVAMVVETPFFEFGEGLDLVRDTYVTYDLRDAAADDPTLAVEWVTDPASSSYTTAVTLAATTARDRKRATINRTALGFGLKLTQANATSDGRLYAIDADGYSLEGDRLV